MISKRELMDSFNEHMEDYPEDTVFDAYHVWLCSKERYSSSIYDLSSQLSAFIFEIERLKHELFTDLKVENARRLEIMMEEDGDSE